MEHPFIDPALQSVEPQSLATDFAENACEILASYRYFRVKQQGDTITSRPMTERAEIISDDPMLLTALRLARVQTPAFSNTVTLAQMHEGSTVTTDNRRDTSDYIIFALEYGVINPEDAKELDDSQLEDDDYTWRPYVLSVTNTLDGEACVLDGSSGKELSDGDIVQAMYALTILQQWLRSVEYDRTVFEDDSNIALHVDQVDQHKTFLPFDQSEALETNYQRHDCNESCNLPEHQQSYLN